MYMYVCIGWAIVGLGLFAGIFFSTAVSALYGYSLLMKQAALEVIQIFVHTESCLQLLSTMMWILYTVL